MLVLLLIRCIMFLREREKKKRKEFSQTKILAGMCVDRLLLPQRTNDGSPGEHLVRLLLSLSQRNRVKLSWKPRDVGNNLYHKDDEQGANERSVKSYKSYYPMPGENWKCLLLFLPGTEVKKSFAGTTQKCMACEKTVYLVDKLTADNRVFHKVCFRCYHCRGTLKLSNYCSFEGVLYCRPHYDQLFKRTGSLDKSFEGTPKLMKPEKPSENENAKSVSNMFGGTRDKCSGCTKTVYPIEKVTVNGTAYHKSCFKCSHGGCTISPSNYIAHEGKLYCKHHHIQLFKEKGNYSQLETERQKNNSAVAAAIKLTTPMEIAAES